MTEPYAPGPASEPAPEVSPEAKPPSWRTLTAALAGIVLLWLPVLSLHLTSALFAALATYGATRAIAAWLRSHRPGFRHAEGLALAGGIAVVSAVLALLVDWVAESTRSLPALLQQMAVTLEQLRATLPPSVAQHLPASLEALREAATTWLRGHAAEVQLWGAHTLRFLGHVLAGIVIGALAAMAPTPTGSGGALPRALRTEGDELVQSFNGVVFAQLRISALNAALTAVFLFGVLPLLGRPLPMAASLLALTFFAGLLPIVGNLISNTVIVVIALGSSPVDAALALAWLVGIHKLEYFLNAHIMGQRIRAQAWELLAFMLLLEAAFGLAGLIAAPVIYAQIKQRLHQRGWW